MRAFLKLSWVEFKLALREPIGTFFTLIFPLILLVLFGSIFGNDPNPDFGGYGMLDISLPGYLGLIIGTISMMRIPVGLAAYREQGILRRLRATPLPPGIVLAAQVMVNLVLLLLGSVMLLIAARLIYNVRLPEAWPALLLALAFCGLSFFAVGFVLASVLPGPRSAQAVGMAIFFPMMMLSGSAMPREIFPEGLRKATEFLPLTQVVVLLRELWLDATWNWTALGVVGVVLVLGVLVSLRTFRWE